MMDLDELKAINDRFGHFHGDRVLRAVGDVIRAGVRRIDTAARYGGDEFVVLLPETDPTGAYVLAEKVRLGVQDMDVELPDGAPRPDAVRSGSSATRTTARPRTS
jgi:diguanylate cyclase (GGDEF)-like protein